MMKQERRKVVEHKRSTTRKDSKESKRKELDMTSCVFSSSSDFSVGSDSSQLQQMLSALAFCHEHEDTRDAATRSLT